MKKIDLDKTEIIFAAIVLITSVINIIFHYDDFFTLSVALSFIGIIGVILFMKKIPFYTYFIFVWILFQIVLISKYEPNYSSGVIKYIPVFDLSQFFSFKLGGSIGDTYSFHINILPFFYFALFRIMKISALSGKRVTFKKYRNEYPFGEVFPLGGTIIKRANLNHDKKWLLVQLDTPIEYDSKAVNHVLIRNKHDDAVIKLNEKNQLVFFRLVYNVDEVKESYNDAADFPFIDWVLCS